MSDEPQNHQICKSDKDVVCLWNGGGWYEIPFTECDTHPKLTRWTYHLTEKAWITGEHIRLFLEEVFSRYPTLAPKF